MTESNLPVLFLKDIVLLPYNEIRIELSSEVDKKILSISERGFNNHILFINLNDALEEKPNVRKLPKIGILGKVKTKLELPNGIIRLVVVGLDRVEILNYIENDDNSSWDITHCSSKSVLGGICKRRVWFFYQRKERNYQKS